MRTLVLILFLILFFLIGFPVNLILTALDQSKPGIKTKISNKIIQKAFRMCLFIAGTDITVKGRENVPTDQPVLFVGNHRSYFDILISYTSSPIPFGFVAKVEMEKIPFLSTWMKNIQCLFLDRTNIKEGLKTVLQGVELLKSGYSVCIFPEGTRNHTDTLLPFKEGSTKMAEKAKVPIVPIAITNSDSIFEKNSFLSIRATHVVIQFGEPVYPDQLEKEERKFLGAYLQQKISLMLESA